MFVAVDGKSRRAAGGIRPDQGNHARRPSGSCMTRGLQVVMLTGDNRVTAEAVAARLGIDEVVAEVLPDEKAAVIKRFQDEGTMVAMAGDGINDAPALAQAQVGIAMGTGTDVAMESAGVTLVKGDLTGIVRARKLSRATMANIRQNLFFAFIYNSLGVPVAAGVLYPFLGILLSPMIAAAAMSLSSVSVVGNCPEIAADTNYVMANRTSRMLTAISRLSAALLFLLLGICLQAEAKTVEYELTVARQEVNFSGKPARAMTINGAIPGPVLRFSEGDLARIKVHNRMDTATSIHWHGILVPPGMDGVPYISFPPIGPGATFTYEFPVRQSGTYWYHSHSGHQEQSGMYGAIVIEPRQHDVHADRDHVVLLSDWTDEDPHTVQRTLKRGSDWYAIEKGSGQSVLGALRLGMLGSFLQRDLQRMPPMDISDVAYDRFLANGRAETSVAAEPGESVRLRIINGSATTYFHLEFAGGPMTIITADGQGVQPLATNRFLIGVAETYDVLVQLKGAGSFEFRATAHDGSGYASVWIGSGSPHPAPAVPRPNLYHPMGHFNLKDIFALTPAGAMGMADSAVQAGKFDRPGMMAMGDMDMGSMQHMEHMTHEAESAAMNMEHMEHTSMTGAAGMGHHSSMGMDAPRTPSRGREVDTAATPDPSSSGPAAGQQTREGL